MATGEENGNGSEQVEADDNVHALTCAICLESYRRPKLLPCFHTFCQSCLQGMAGSSSSFPCPSCRKLVLLSSGGVAALQANFYIERDMWASAPSPQQQLCDVCTDDREAVNVCLQCRQKFCDPCRKSHDAFTMSRGHSVVSLAQQVGGAGTGGLLPDRPGDARENEACPRHPNQPRLLYCQQCQEEMCMQCKLTRHDGHPTDDLADVRATAETKLQAMVAELTGRIQQLDQLAEAVSHRRDTLQQQQRLTEQDLTGRADALQQWLGQSLDDAVTSVKKTSQELDRAMEGRAQRLKNQRLSLQAMQDHLIRVVKDGKATDVAALEAQLSCSTLDGVDVERVKMELTQDFTAFSVKHDLAAVNQAQLRSFIGVLEPTQPPLSPEDSATSMQCAPSPTKEADSRSSVGPCSVVGASGPSSAQRFVTTAQKKPAREFIYSKNPSTVQTMCPISEGRVWIRHTPGSYCSSHLSLLDAERNSTTDVSAENDGLCYLAHDAVISWESSSSKVRLIRPDGSMTCHDIGFRVSNIFSCAANKIHYVKSAEEKDRGLLYEVKFVMTSKDGPYNEETDCRASSTNPTHATSVPHHLKITEKRPVEYTRLPFLKNHSSSKRMYFAFIYNTGYGKYGVIIYSIKYGQMVRQSSYPTDKCPQGACFCLVEGQELMLVTVWGDNRVHVVDHSDKCRFVRYLDTTPLTLQQPGCLASDFYHTVWVGCEGEKVVRVDL